MNKWAPIAPTKSGGTKGAAGPSPSSASSAGGMLSSFGAVLKPSKAGPSTSAAARARAGRSGPRVGRWPEDIIVRIVAFLPVHDVPAFARANRALARIARDEGTWEARCRVLGISEPGEKRTV
jgi:recyclin-1